MNSSTLRPYSEFGRYSTSTFICFQHSMMTVTVSNTNYQKPMLNMINTAACQSSHTSIYGCDDIAYVCIVEVMRVRLNTVRRRKFLIGATLVVLVIGGTG